jgi:hypothetical protein
MAKTHQVLAQTVISQTPLMTQSVRRNLIDIRSIVVVQTPFNQKVSETRIEMSMSCFIEP